MSERCALCAYADKQNNNFIWCRFHKQEVKENNICDDYLSVMDAPAMSTLLDKVVAESKGKPVKKGVPIGNHLKDILAYILITLFIIVGVMLFLFS